MPLSIPYSFTNGTTAEAGEVNSNFANVKTFVDALATGVNIDSNAITAAKIASDSITTSKIANDAVTADKLADTSVVPGSYTIASITVDAQGRITTASSGSSITGENDQIVLAVRVFG